jgi:hypothetical protein
MIKTHKVGDLAQEREKIERHSTKMYTKYSGFKKANTFFGNAI